MIAELQINGKIDDLDIDIKLKPQGPLTWEMQEKIGRFRLEDREHRGRTALQKTPDARKESFQPTPCPVYIPSDSTNRISKRYS